MTTVFVHGFWGGPADWNDVLARLPLAARTFCPDLYRDEVIPPDDTPLAWADRFVHRVRTDVGERCQLVAYSMGGRLALHALLRVPGLFARALIVSARPFAPAPASADDVARTAWERDWANRFATEDWATLTTAWDGQEVLSGSRAPTTRSTRDADRDALARSLDRWSPRRHAFGVEQMRSLPNSVDFAFGARDQKYLGVAKQLQELPAGGQITIIPNAGHRVPLDAPDFIADWVNQGGL